MKGSSSLGHPSTLLAPNSSSPDHNYHYANLPPDQRARIQEDLADRERQASSLAAAGRVAESVNYAKPSVIGQVLQAPPPLVGMPPPAHPPYVDDGDIPMEGINWNDLGGNVDDIDMDFAAMFDPEQEQAFMQDAAMQLSQPLPSIPGGPSHLDTTPPRISAEQRGAPNPLNATSV